MRLSFDEVEASVQADIKKALKDRGWWVEKVELPARNGCCDLLCMKDGRHVFLEVKKPGEKPNRLQSNFRVDWVARGGEAYWVDNVADALRHLS